MEPITGKRLISRQAPSHTMTLRCHFRCADRRPRRCLRFRRRRACPRTRPRRANRACRPQPPATSSKRRRRRSWGRRRTRRLRCACTGHVVVPPPRPPTGYQVFTPTQDFVRRLSWCAQQGERAQLAREQGVVNAACSLHGHGLKNASWRIRVLRVSSGYGTGYD